MTNIKLIEYKLNEAEDAYVIPSIGELPRSTVILGKHIDKSEPLKWWASGVALEFVTDNLIKPLIEHDFKVTDEAKRALEEFAKEKPTEIFKRAKAYHKEKSKEAMDIGSRVHKVIERIIKAMMSGSEGEETVSIPDDIKLPVNAFLEWWNKNDVDPLASELTVWAMVDGTPFGYAGTLDGVWNVNGMVTTVDIKTSAGVYEDHPLQVASYDHALNEMIMNGLLEGEKSEATAILRLDKETGMPEYVAWNREQADLHYLIFSQLCVAYHLIAKSKDNEREAKLKVKLKERMDKKIKAWGKPIPF